MVVQGLWILEDRRGKNDCLFAEGWVIVANRDFCEHLMCRAAGATPTRREKAKSRSFRRK